MMGLSGWCGSVMRMPTPTDAIASSRTRRAPSTACDDRRGGFDEALVTNYLYPLPIARQFMHAIPNPRRLSLFGGPPGGGPRFRYGGGPQPHPPPLPSRPP